MPVRTRGERSGDEAAIDAVHSAAFASPPHAEPAEVALVRALRASDAWIPELSLVAQEGDRVIGHVCCSRAHVDDSPALGLGPIGVLPDAQGRGIGAMLMTATIERAHRRGEALIGLLGSPAYYARFGFGAARRLRVEPPDPSWGDHFQVLVLGDSSPTGVFQYAAPFTGL